MPAFNEDTLSAEIINRQGLRDRFSAVLIKCMVHLSEADAGTEGFERFFAGDVGARVMIAPRDHTKDFQPLLYKSSSYGKKGSE